MGIQDIIKDGLEDAPTQNVFVNDGISDDEDIPVAENIYTDASSDTDLSDEDRFDSSSIRSSISSEYIHSASLESLLNFEDNVVQDSSAHANFFNSSLGNSNRRLEEPCPAVAAVVDPSNSSNEPSSISPIKFKNSIGKSRQGLGKKKARRLENARQLDQMRGDFDGSTDCDINDFMPVDCTFRFTQILDDINLTNKVLNPSVDNEYDSHIVDKINAREKKHKDATGKRKKPSAHAAFNNLFAFEKDLFRRRNLPMGMVEYLDTCLLSFFEENPTGTYISEPLSSFERMMLHSIAHFYELKSFSFDGESCRCRQTKVTNSLNYFDPPCLCLSKYIEQLSAKSVNFNSRKCKRFRRK